MSLQLPPNETAGELRRLGLAFFVAFLIMLAWQIYFKPPVPPVAPATPVAAAPQTVAASAVDAPVKKARPSVRLPIRSSRLHGSLSLDGARFDDITLAQYHETVDAGSPEIVLLASAEKADAYFAEFGWLGANAPTRDSTWKTDAKEIRPNQPVILYWNNGKGLRFEKRITLDEHYMFTIEQSVINQSGAPVALTSFGRIQRHYLEHGKHYAISHEGALGVFGRELQEVTYQTMREKGPQKFANTSGWLGFGDKYWLSAAIPDPKLPVEATFSSISNDRYQADFAAAPQTLAAGARLATTTRFFAGAKEVAVLDQYTAQGVPLFDRAVDFGVLYIITKPIFRLLNFFYALVGNFGLAIMLLTLLIKAVMFPLASKSYRSMNQMKKLQPQMEALKTKHADDKIRFQQEVMAMYKREKVNPASGCLPMLVQIPIFFSLYKVLFVTIEMRHAPFFGWVRDLSAPDPSNIWNLFGALPWHVPDFHILGMDVFHIGWWPLVMCLTMVLQQAMSPKPTDQAQAKMLAIMPYFFLFLFASFPVGLVIYWSWSNTLTVLQQWWINHHLRRGEKAPRVSLVGE